MSLVRILRGVFCCLVLSGIAAAGEFRGEIDLNGKWEKVWTKKSSRRVPKSGWTETVLPATETRSGEGGASYVWFKREIEIPQEWSGRQVLVRLGGARYDAHVFLDGRRMGSRLDGYTPFEVDLTRRAKPGRKHTIAIRCQDWSAAFKEGFTLPDPVRGELRSAPQGQVLTPVGGHFSGMGIWDDVSLVSRPKSHLAGLTISTSHRKGTLVAAGKFVNPPPGTRVGFAVIDGSRTILSVAPVPVGADGSWRLSAAFQEARRWSPEDPHLYTIRVSARDDAGSLDVVEQRFGFRELWAEGPDFYFNGVKRHLLATAGWPSMQPITRDQVRQVLEQVKAGNNVALRLHTQPWRKRWVEVADEVGVMIIMEAALWCDSGGAYAYKDPRFWENYRGHLKRMIERDRNNASLVMWSIENELLHCGCGRYDNDCEKKLAELGRFVKEIDPDHLITYESDHDPDGVADVIGLHYPREIPWFPDRPNTCDWLDESVKTGTEGGLMGSRDKWFKWERDKPLYIGEYLWVPTRDGTPGTVYFGDLAYSDTNEFDQRAKIASWGPQTVAYRRAGVSGLCPWTEFESGISRFPLDMNPDENRLYQAQKAAYKPVAVFLREVDTRFFGGDTVTRTFDLFNDSVEEKRMALKWRFGKRGRKGSKTVTVGPAEMAVVVAEFKVPRVTRKRKMTLSAELFVGGNKVDGVRQPCEVVPLTPITAPKGRKVLVYDPEAKWFKLLRREGLTARKIGSLAELPSDGLEKTILIVVPGALGTRADRDRPVKIGAEDGSRALAPFLNGGGRALIMAQETLAGVPLGVEIVGHHSTMTFALDAGHPVLKGLNAGDLKFWRPGNYVTHSEIRRPGRGGAKAVTVSGGGNGVGQAPILDLPVGNGLVVLCQALVGRKITTEPAARVILQNSLNYLAGWRLPSGDTVLIGGAVGFRERLKLIGVDYVERADIGPARLVIMSGGGSAIEAAAPALKAYLDRSGSIVYWHAPDPDTLAAVGAKLGLEDVNVAPASGPLLLRGLDDPVLAGVAREDVNYRGGSIGPSWMRATDPDPTVIDRAVVPGVPEGESQRIELETFDLRGGQVSDTEGNPRLVDRDDNKMVAFYTNGSASRKVRGGEEAGLYGVTVIAGGTPVNGGYPLVTIGVNGIAVAQVQLSEEKVRAYPTLAALPAGEFELSVSFTNDAYEPPEDRNLYVDAVEIGRTPVPSGKADLLSLPAAIAAVPVGNGRIVFDCVRWDTTTTSRLKGQRYASVLLRNLGASFFPPATVADWIPAGRFEKVDGGEFFFIDRNWIRFHSWGEAQAEFECARAGKYVIWIRGNSTSADGEFGKALVTVDDEVVGEVVVSGVGGQETRLELPVAIESGKHRLRVKFTNDFNTGSEDRNLFISAIGFAREE